MPRNFIRRGTYSRRSACPGCIWATLEVATSRLRSAALHQPPPRSRDRRIPVAAAPFDAGPAQPSRARACSRLPSSAPTPPSAQRRASSLHQGEDLGRFSDRTRRYRQPSCLRLDQLAHGVLIVIVEACLSKRTGSAFDDERGSAPARTVTAAEGNLGARAIHKRGGFAYRRIQSTAGNTGLEARDDDGPGPGPLWRSNNPGRAA